MHLKQGSLLLFSAIVFTSSGCNIKDPEAISYCENESCESNQIPDAGDPDVTDEEDATDTEDVEPDPTCDDGVQNGDESDTDCGGSDDSCERCTLGQTCNTGSDCTTGICVDNICSACAPGESPFGAGSGDSEDPYLLCSPQHLQNISDAPEAHFELASDIDLSDLASFTPISPENGSFQGTLNGAEFELQNLKIQAEDENNIGLFAAIGSGAIIHNLKITGAEVEGNDFVGILAGQSEGELSDIQVSGRVEGFVNVGGLAGHHAVRGIKGVSADVQIIGNAHVGGLFGVQKDGIIETSRTTGSVMGDKALGGLVGLSLAGEIRESSSEVKIAAESAVHVGGLVGELATTQIEGSSATGDIKGQQRVGGLLGLAKEANIRTSYATGKVTGVEEVGGLVGFNQEGNIINSYAIGVVTSTGVNIGGLIGHNLEGKLENTYAYGDPAPYHAATHRGPLIGLQEGYDPEVSYWRGDCSLNWSTPGLCRSTGQFKHPDEFTTWLESGNWKMSPERPILSWEED